MFLPCLHKFLRKYSFILQQVITYLKTLNLVFQLLFFCTNSVVFFLSLLAYFFAFSLFSSSSLPIKLWCSTCVSLIYFPSKMVFGCQPACTFCEGDNCFCMRCCCFLLWSQTESIFSQHFFQLIWTRCFFLTFPSESDFEQAQPVAFSWTLWLDLAFQFRHVLI